MMKALRGRLDRLAGAARVMRPRALAQLSRSSDTLQQQVADLNTAVAALTGELKAVSLRERQLRAVLRADADQERERASLDHVLDDARIAEHSRTAIAAASLVLEPFPHCVVDRLLPDDYYDALVTGLPPVPLFADRPANKQQLVVPFEIAPQYGCRVWEHMAKYAVDRVIAPAIADKFREPLLGWLREMLPEVDQEALDRLRLSASDGRILLRGRGYRIRPHRDPKWGFVTCLLYLARPGDDESWGTQLYSVDGDVEANGAQPHWIEDAQCRLATDVTFQRNRALIFLNSGGAHGAVIPEDAEPANLERYAYQFRVGADRRSIGAVTATMSSDHRTRWAGKITDY